MTITNIQENKNPEASKLAELWGFRTAPSHNPESESNDAEESEISKEGETTEDSASDYKLPRVYHFGMNLSWNLINVHIALTHYNEDHGPTVFFKNGSLVYAKTDENGRIFIKQMKRADLNYILMKAGTWKKGDKDEELHEIDPRFLDTVLEGSSPEDFENISPLKGVRSGAYLTSNGIEVKKGFNKETGILLTKEFNVPPVPENPDENDIANAKEIFRKVFAEFKFESDIDFENAILASVTLITQPLLSEPVPILVVDKNTSGAGGTFLCTVIGIAALGSAPEIRPTTNRAGEMDKEVRSAVISGDSFVVFDNIKPGTDWAPEIMLSVTSGTGETSMRLMGSLNSVTCSPKMMFAVNGINIQARADVVRRMFRIKLVTKYALVDEKPFSMTKSQKMLQASELHPMFVWAVAVFRKAWLNAGCPLAPSCGGNFDEYPQWWRECVSVLYYAGYHELLKNQKELQAEENSTESEGAELIEALWNLFGGNEFSPKALQKVLIADAHDRKTGTFDGVLNLCPDSVVKSAMKGELTSSVVGRFLASNRDRKFAGCKKYLKKITRTSEGCKYVLADIESQDHLV